MKIEEVTAGRRIEKHNEKIFSEIDKLEAEKLLLGNMFLLDNTSVVGTGGAGGAQLEIDNASSSDSHPMCPLQNWS